MYEPKIRDLAVIGDQRTAALLTKDGEVLWYCPRRFDRPSLLAGLLDPERGGRWRVELPGASFAGRRYLADSGVLETRYAVLQDTWVLTDWMPRGKHVPSGICRFVARECILGNVPQTFVHAAFVGHARPQAGHRGRELTGAAPATA